MKSQLKSSKPKKKKPTLRINMAQSVDGHTIQPDGRWSLGSSEDKKRMDSLRLWADCIIASRRSIENDNPNLFARTKPNARQPVPVVILADASKKIIASSRIFLHPHPPGEFWILGNTIHKISDIVSMTDNLPSSHRALKWKIYCFQNVHEIYDSLWERNFLKILLEGGPSLNGHFLKENLIDEIFFTLVPYAWAGQNFDRIITTAQPLDITRFRLINLERRKDEVFFRYKRNRTQA